MVDLMFYKALKENLRDRNVYQKLESLVRKSLFEGISAGNDSQECQSEGVLLVNELIREYLSFQGYHNSLSVLEAGTTNFHYYM
jgi:hypothetical protein